MQSPGYNNGLVTTVDGIDLGRTEEGGLALVERNLDCLGIIAGLAASLRGLTQCGRLIQALPHQDQDASITPHQYWRAAFL